MFFESTGSGQDGGCLSLDSGCGTSQVRAVSQNLNQVRRILTQVLPATLVELRIRGLREFQRKGERQILEIHGHSLVIDQTALENADVLRSLKLHCIGQKPCEFILDNRIGTQLNRDLCHGRHDVVVFGRRLHRNLVIDLQELVVGSRNIGNGCGDDCRSRTQIRGNRRRTAESQQLTQPKILRTRRPSDSIGSDRLLAGTSLEDQGKRRVIRRILNREFTQVGVLGHRPSLRCSRRIQCRFDRRLQSRLRLGLPRDAGGDRRRSGRTLP